MPKLDSRQYRTINFALPDSNKKNKFNSDYYVEGYATTFEPYVLYDDGNEKIYESFSKECFKNCDMSDIIFQFDHAGKVFARLSNNTLSVEADENGLFVCADLSKSEASRAMYEEIKNGLVTRMSWGFMPGEYHYNKETKTIIHTSVRKIFDVSAVSIPANDDTTIQARKFADGVIEGLMQELQKREKHKKLIKLLMEV